MNVLHFKYALEVANTGSINKAAENLLMGQPNLSRAIKELEASLGITLFNRTTRGMTTTPEGEEFLTYARKILKEIDDLESLYRGDVAKTRRFSISVPRASYCSYAFAQFSKLLGNEPCELFYKETNAMRAIKNLLQNDYNLGVLRYASGFDKYFKDLLIEKGIIGNIICEFKYVLLMHKDSPLAKLNEIHFSDLSNYIEVCHGDPYVPNLSLSAVKKEELSDYTDRHIFVFERASQFELLSENKNMFMWVSPLSQKLLDAYGLIQRDSPDNTKLYKDLLIFRKDYKLSKLDNDFITELSKAKRMFN